MAITVRKRKVTLGEMGRVAGHSANQNEAANVTNHEGGPASGPGAAGRVEPSELPALFAFLGEAYDEQAGRITLSEFRSAASRGSLVPLTALVDPALHPAVIKKALARGERFIGTRQGEGLVALGVLRTSPTPGVDEGEEFEIVAKRVAVRAAHEVRLESGESTFVLRAYGMVETIAKDISTRASRAHKLIGRLLQLN